MTIDVSSQVTTSQFIGGEEMNASDFTTPFGQIVTILNNLANGAQDVEAIRLAELGADPATPPTGKWKLYTKPEGIFVMDDTGAVTGPLGTGGGGGASDAAEVTFTPAILANWDGSADPGDVNDALDQLAARLVAHTHDDRYYTESETDTLLTGKANTAHTHTHTDITDFDSEVNALIAAAGGGGAGAPDNASYIVQTPSAGLSAEQALSELGTGLLKNTTATGVLSIAVAADLPAHTHDDRYYTESESDSLLSGKADTAHTHVHTDITDFDAEVNALISAAGSGPHDHNDLYYTEAEVDTLLSGKSNVGHTHTATDITSGTLAQGRGGFGVDTTHVSFGPGRFGQLSAGGTPTSIKENYAATVAPSATDDENSGYRVGSLWFDTTADKAYLCVDATASSAVWIEAGGGGGSAGAAASYTFNEPADITTTSGSFVDVSTNSNFTITTTGGDILVGFHGNFKITTTGACTAYLDVAIDGVREGDSEGLAFVFMISNGSGADTYQPGGFTRLIRNVPAGTHTVTLQWRTLAPAGVALMCATTTNLKTRPQFWVKEVTAGGGSGGVSDLIIIQDQKASGTGGGTATSGAWQTRDLNTIVTDVGGHASIANNQVTLAAGTYEINASAPAFYCGVHRIRWYNVTDASEDVLGQVAHSAMLSGSSTTLSVLSGRFTIAASKTFELQHRVDTTRTTNGFGMSTGWGTEIYSMVTLRKVE